jgi:cytidine deaminase
MRDTDRDALRAVAEDAMGRAYAPYSRFRVGAALLGSDGTIVPGCNVENASYGATICAERGAVAAAVARGVRAFEALAIATETDEPVTPCGICRQLLSEFAPALEIVSYARGGRAARYNLGDLLPHAFSPASLERRSTE